jgi:predicted TPR repeat methyltransferase
MGTELYTEGAYLEQNPDWHAADSEWKATQILGMLERNDLRPASICEVGCGAGEILRQLHDRLEHLPSLFGYEISPQAFKLAVPRSTDRLTFRLGDFLEEPDSNFDLMLAIDVIEHVEDYRGFLRAVQARAPLTLLHIPLELSALAALRPSMLTAHRELLGHLHVFTDATALDMLESVGYEIVDWTFTAASSTQPMTGKNRLLETMRRLVFPRAPTLASRLLGGYSMLVLARPVNASSN